MSVLSLARPPARRPAAKPVNSSEFTMDEVVPHLVGHTVEEVERELILHTLVHHCGNRTLSASALGISIRGIRNKINGYENLGIS